VSGVRGECVVGGVETVLVAVGWGGRAQEHAFTQGLTASVDAGQSTIPCPQPCAGGGECPVEPSPAAGRAHLHGRRDSQQLLRGQPVLVLHVAAHDLLQATGHHADRCHCHADKRADANVPCHRAAIACRAATRQLAVAVQLAVQGLPHHLPPTERRTSSLLTPHHPLHPLHLSC
jgi:hypothetical protein